MWVVITHVLPSIDLTRSGSFDKSPKPLHSLEAHRQVTVAAVAPRAARTSREGGAASTIPAELDKLLPTAGARTQPVRRLTVGGHPLGSVHEHFPAKERARWATQ